MGWVEVRGTTPTFVVVVAGLDNCRNERRHISTPFDNISTRLSSGFIFSLHFSDLQPIRSDLVLAASLQWM